MVVVFIELCFLIDSGEVCSGCSEVVFLIFLHFGFIVVVLAFHILFESSVWIDIAIILDSRGYWCGFGSEDVSVLSSIHFNSD